MTGYSFSRREKVLLAILGVMLLGALWYLVVFQPCQDRLATAQAQEADARTQLVTYDAQLARMRTVQDELAGIGSGGSSVVPLPDYDNQAAVIAELNTVLSGVDGYNINFADPETDDGGIVRRTVTLSFGCDSFATARSVIAAVAGSHYRDQVQSVSISTSTSGRASTGISASRSGSSTSAYTVSMTVVYYEKA